VRRSSKTHVTIEVISGALRDLVYELHEMKSNQAGFETRLKQSENKQPEAHDDEGRLETDLTGGRQTSRELRIQATMVWVLRFHSLSPGNQKLGNRLVNLKWTLGCQYQVNLL